MQDPAEPPRPRRPSRRDAMRTEELPLAGPAASTVPTRARPPARKPARTADSEAPDLFDSPAPVSAPVFAPVFTPDPDPDPEPTVPRAAPPPPSHLSPDAALLQRVDPRSFRPNEKPDAYLYWLTDRDAADHAMRHGLPIDPADPVMLSDRPDMLARLAGLAEDTEIAPSSIAVLRLRRIAAAPFLEPGPGPSCYRLSGQNVPA